MTEENKTEHLEGITPKKEKAIEEQDKLDNLMDNYFKNSNAVVPPEDGHGVMDSMMSPEEPEEDIESSTGIVEEEPEEEEIFLVHNDGEITSEVTEQEEPEEKIVYKQSLLERAIYNKAINKVYDNITELEEEIETIIKTYSKDIKVLGGLYSNLQKISLDELKELKRDLNRSKFSAFAEIPNEEINIDAIENKELKDKVNSLIRKEIIEITQGGTK